MKKILFWGMLIAPQFLFAQILHSSDSNVGLSAQKRNWEDTKRIYTRNSRSKIIITNSLPKGGGIVNHKGKEYNYFIFWTQIQNESSLPLELSIKHPVIKSFISPESHVQVAFPKETMSIDKLQVFDYGLTGIPWLLTNQLPFLNKRISPNNHIMFYTAVFIHQTQWPVRAAYIVKGKALFYKIMAGKDSVMVPCGEMK